MVGHDIARVDPHDVSGFDHRLGLGHNGCGKQSAELHQCQAGLLEFGGGCDLKAFITRRLWAIDARVGKKLSRCQVNTAGAGDRASLRRAIRQTEDTGALPCHDDVRALIARLPHVVDGVLRDGFGSQDQETLRAFLDQHSCATTQFNDGTVNCPQCMTLNDPLLDAYVRLHRHLINALKKLNKVDVRCIR